MMKSNGFTEKKCLIIITGLVQEKGRQNLKWENVFPENLPVFVVECIVWTAPMEWGASNANGHASNKINRKSQVKEGLILMIILTVNAKFLHANAQLFTFVTKRKYWLNNRNENIWNWLTQSHSQKLTNSSDLRMRLQILQTKEWPEIQLWLVQIFSV